jgi:hypothetical protein
MSALQSSAKSRLPRERDEGDQLHQELEQFARAD